MGIIQSSFPESFLHENHISSSTYGFVYSAFSASGSHHHLSIRPEDIWFAILSQTGFYINAHAEELRPYFVSHDDRKELEVIEFGTIISTDIGALAEMMTDEIQKNVFDPELQTWVMPSFSTTTHSDRVVASVLMMGAMQNYFSFKMILACGIPSVTLLGEREDWAEVQRRLGHLKHFGDESTRFAELLEPIMRHFILSFDEPESLSVKEFWGKIVHEADGGSGPV